MFPAFTVPPCLIRLRYKIINSSKKNMTFPWNNKVLKLSFKNNINRSLHCLMKVKFKPNFWSSKLRPSLFLTDNIMLVCLRDCQKLHRVLYTVNRGKYGDVMALCSKIFPDIGIFWTTCCFDKFPLKCF